MLCYRDLKMSKSSQWIESNANVAVFVVFFFYHSVKLFIPACCCCCEFVGKRCQAQALFDKILSLTLSLFEYFSGKSKMKTLSIGICEWSEYAILSWWSYSYSVEVWSEDCRLLSISYTKLSTWWSNLYKKIQELSFIS